MLILSFVKASVKNKLFSSELNKKEELFAKKVRQFSFLLPGESRISSTKTLPKRAHQAPLFHRFLSPSSPSPELKNTPQEGCAKPQKTAP